MTFDEILGYVAVHAPGDDLDYGFEWAGVLIAGESVSVSSWTGQSGVTLSRESVAGSITSVYVAGGVDGQNYQITNTITVSPSSRKYSRTITLQCRKAIR